ncbi:hypothetical protein [Cupriavidus pauculus]|uniref:hypothetical protein n=1 Tax=Cupriavidus pauculus TaxID=82633 RepID=UPI001D0C6F7D|nr:hypothetical protein [Cupriavidus pauculus]
MKILAHISVEKVILNERGVFTFRSEEMECEVVRVLRRKIGANDPRQRFYYQADVVRPAQMHLEVWDGNARNDGTVRVNVNRFRNKQWKPPVFPAGADVVEISREATEKSAA